MANKLDFKCRRVLITGGGRGIGLGIAKKLLDNGATVIVLEKDEALLQNLAKTFPSIIGVPVDLTNWDACAKAVESVLPIHHLVNSVGIYPDVQLFDITEKHIDSVTNLNFKVPVHVAQIVAKDMIARKIENGTIVNISSTFDKIHSKDSGLGIYSCSKAAVTTLTKVLALELQDVGIRVNAVRPGVVNTETLRAKTGWYAENVVKPIAAKQLKNQLVEPEDVADAALFLSSGMSGMITGTTLTVDGGGELH